MTIVEAKRRIRGLSSLIGNTPLLKIRFKYKGKERIIYAKAENLNMTGSIKDRMALHILREAYSRDAIEPAGLIIEATSGNTGISFSALGRAMGHPVAIFMPDWMSAERINLIRSFGAQINLISSEEGGFLGSIDRANQLTEETPGAFSPNQFSNIDNIQAHYLTTGPEIWWQLRFQSLTPDAFIAGCRDRRNDNGSWEISERDASRDQLPCPGACQLTHSFHRVQSRQPPYPGYIG